MNDQPQHNTPSVDPSWEAEVQTRARQFEYPVTPDITRSVRAHLTSPQRTAPLSRRLLWAVAIVIVLIGGLLSVPQVRAALIDFFRIGSVIILPNGATETPSPISSPVVSPQPTATLLPSLLNMAGETTLEQAQAKVHFAIRLPQYPSDLGAPDKVYLQDIAGDAAILVWLDPSRPDGVRLSLHLLTNQVISYKLGAQVEQETRINGYNAIWTTGPYMFAFKQGRTGSSIDMGWIVHGHVLIWTDGALTYRLEVGDMSLDEAVKIAESIYAKKP
jgi:hypothetical protein